MNLNYTMNRTISIINMSETLRKFSKFEIYSSITKEEICRRRKCEQSEGNKEFYKAIAQRKNLCGVTESCIHLHCRFHII